MLCKKIKNQSEADLQKQVAAFFLVEEAKRDDFFFYHIPNGSNVGKFRGKILKDMGLRAGVADLEFMLMGGKNIYIELKSMTGTMSDDQKKFKAICDRLGHSYSCLKGSAEEVIELIADILESHGLAKVARPLTMKRIAERGRYR